MAVQAAIFVVGFALLLAAPLTQQIDDAKFTYLGATGPDKWGSLSPNYSPCSTGKLQSPVNIVKEETVSNLKLQPLHRIYKTTNASLCNNGYVVGMDYASDVGVLIEGGKKYNLKQMHWHSPSEHTINGVGYPLELHLVHVADDSTISVVGILYNYGTPDPLLLQLESKIKQLHEGQEGYHIPIDRMQTMYLGRDSQKYYRYAGSLTTPPCTENVTWNILLKVRNVTKEQVDALRGPLSATCKNNARPVLPLNGRKVEVRL